MENKVKSLYDISWKVSETEYRSDPALSYSTLAKFKRTGFNGLSTLFDEVSSPSLTFGSAVDSIITGGQEEFHNRFLVVDIPSLGEKEEKIAKELFKTYGIVHRSLDDLETEEINKVAKIFEYYNNYGDEKRASIIRNKCGEYYKIMALADNKTIITNTVYLEILNTVDALKSSNITKDYFSLEFPDSNIEKLYQLKFKATLHGIDYRCMADLLIIDYEKKTIQPVDLKTTGHPEWDFYESFITWDYQIQARLYWRIIRKNMDEDDYFKDFKLLNYQFIVVNKTTLTPLIWVWEFSSTVGPIEINHNSVIELDDPEDIGKILYCYLNLHVDVPFGIHKDRSNSLYIWLENNGLPLNEYLKSNLKI